MSALDESAATPPIDADIASDPWMRALASALDGSEAIDPMALVRSQLEAQAQANPKAAMILRLLEQRRLRQEAQAHEEASAESDDDVDLSAVELEATDVASEDMQNLNEVVSDLYSELTTLRKRHEALAAAAGACPACFGEDPSCERCRGRGVPGSRAPEPALFRKYVLPAMKRARAIERGRSDPSRERSAGAKGAVRAVAGPATSAF